MKLFSKSLITSIAIASFLQANIVQNNTITPIEDESSQTIDILEDKNNLDDNSKEKNTTNLNEVFIQNSQDNENINTEQIQIEKPSIITIEDLKAKPKGDIRNFYIWQFLQQNITPYKAHEALSLAQNVDMKIFELYAKKINHDETYAIIECINGVAQELINSSADCINLGLTPNKILLLDYIQKQNAIDTIASKYKNQATIINILNSSLPFTKLVSTTPKIFFEIFNNININYIKNYFNYKISPSILNKLSQFEEFNKTIEIIVTNDNLILLQQSFLREFDTSKLNTQSLFYLALNSIKLNDINLAIKLLEEAKTKASSQKELDKINFWLYKTTKNSKFLTNIKNSNDINIYSIYVKEESSILVLDEELIAKYPTSYNNILKELDIKKQALIYAIAKKESNFDPNYISNSFNLGVMGLKPNEIKKISKELDEPYILENQFTPFVSIKYALQRLHSLEKSSQKLIFLIYGYKYGLDFAKITTQKLEYDLKSNNTYHPFIDIELATNYKAKDFAENILINYYIYINKLEGTTTNFFTLLLQTLENNYQEMSGSTVESNQD